LPEGDTLHKLARRLAPALVGTTVRSAWGREQGDIRPASGERIEAVRALGKNLIVELERVAPTARVGDLDDDCLRALYLRARELLQANLGDGARVTVTPELARRGERHWVYQRTHRPCFRCGTPIGSQRQGDQARTTYCCPGCQRLSAR
jgi:formamidopyrimidine-DNA glycosylase